MDTLLNHQDRNPGKGKWLFLLVLTLSTLLSACNHSDNGTSNLPSLPVLSVETFWDFTHEQARAWRSDAQVYDINARVELPNGITSGPSIDFAFHSAQDLLTEFIVTCSVDSCQSYEVERSPGHPIPLCPIEDDAFQIDTKQALTTALENGLDDYVFDERATMYLDLSRTGACLDHVVWRTSGFIPAPTQSTFVWIDAMTGEVIESPY